jgi:hypothetical protein
MRGDTRGCSRGFLQWDGTAAGDRLDWKSVGAVSAVDFAARHVLKEIAMRKSLVVASICVALVVGFTVGYFARPEVAGVAGSGVSQRATVGATGARRTTMGDEHEAWAKVPATSPEYATAQRLLGYNYFAHDKHDLKEAKRHVDLALEASPDDPKVLEDAGRVYILAGLTEEGTAMLKKADTGVARDFLARR